MTFDADALEVEDESKPPFDFTLRGEKFELPVSGAMQWQDQLSLAEKTELEAMQTLLGPDQFERFTKVKCSAGRLKGIIEAWHRYQGLQLGESAASSPS